jgi:hypothetical protein
MRIIDSFRKDVRRFAKTASRKETKTAILELVNHDDWGGIVVYLDKAAMEVFYNDHSFIPNMLEFMEGVRELIEVLSVKAEEMKELTLCSILAYNLGRVEGMMSIIVGPGNLPVSTYELEYEAAKKKAKTKKKK